jgi:hypothetical protein
MDPTTAGIGLVGGIINGISNWYSAKEQRKIMERELDQRDQDRADRRKRWAQEDMMKRMLRLDMERNVRAKQRKMEEMAPIFDKQRNELEKLNESRLRTSSGEDIMVKANDMKVFLLDMVKNALKKNEGSLEKELKGLGEIDREMAEHKRYRDSFKF